MIEILLQTLRHLSAVSKIRTVFLTGGRTAPTLYRAWREDSSFQYYKNAKFYFGDERCVSPNDRRSNYWVAADAFANKLHPEQFERIRGESDPTTEVNRYALLMPDVIDLIFFSVGEDGHIASLFPRSPAITSEEKIVVVAKTAGTDLVRISIAPRVIQKAREIIVMASGENKGMILAKALRNPNYIDLPVCLTIGRTWVLDREASKAFVHYAPKDYQNTKILYA